MTIPFEIDPGVNAGKQLGRLFLDLYRYAKRAEALGLLIIPGSAGGAETLSDGAKTLDPVVTPPHLAARERAASGACLLLSPCDPRGADWSPAPRVGEVEP